MDISLLPLSLEHHTAALQALYIATPSYWQMYKQATSPPGQAAADLRAVAATPGRAMLGIVRRLVDDDASAGAELIGVLDYRLHWPDEQVVYIGMLMVAEPYQRRDVGRQSWSLLQPWLAEVAGMTMARLGVEQFNTKALQFFEALGFSLTGESNRLRVGEKLIRLLYMQKRLTPNA